VDAARQKTATRAPAPAVAPPTPVASAISTRIQMQSITRVSSPHDPAEKEADATAKKIMRMPAPEVSSAGVGEGRIARKIRSPWIARFADSVPVIARKGEGPSTVAPAVASEIGSSTGSGSPLPSSSRGFMESRFGADFGKVRIHTGERAAKLNRRLSAQAFTVGNQIFFGKDKFRPESQDGKELLAHELTHTIQQGAAAQRSPDVAVSEQASPHVQRLGISDALDYFADKANNIPGFRMFTIVLGVNPINMSSVDRSAANILRAIVEFMPGGALITQALDNYGVFDKVGGWIEQQLHSLGVTGSAIRAAINEFLDSLGWSDIFDLGGVWNRAKRIFSEPIDRIISFVKSLASAVLKFIKDAILRPIAALAAKSPAWDLLCAVLGQNPITGDPVPRTAETLIGGFMKLIGQEEIWENIKKANALGRAWAWFQGALSGLMGFVQQIPGLFVQALESLEIADIVLLPQAFIKVGKVFVSFFAKFVSWAGNTIWDLLEIIFSVVAPSVLVYLRKAAGAFKTILKNPGAFVGNLVRAAKLGLSQFVGNFLKHLKASLVGWLTGALGDAGVYIPQAFTLAEIGKFVLSVLGITWPKIRAKIVKIIGEPAMKALEIGFDIVVKLVTGGPAAAWEAIKEKLADMRDMLMQSIMSFVQEKVVTAAVTKLLSMLSPVGAFIQAIIAIYNTVMFFVERLKQIAQVAAAFIDSISAIANGVIGAAANRVEQTMAGLLTLVISFLARLAGLGKVSDAVVKLVKAVQAKVDQAIDFAINWIVQKAKAILAALTGKKDKKPNNEALQNAVAEVKQEMAAKDATLSSVQAKLPAIQGKHQLTSLALVKDAEDRYHVKATINPTLEGPPGVLFTAEELAELDKVAAEYAAHVNKKEKERPGFKAAAMVDLEGFIKSGGNVQTGKMVESMAAPALDQLASEAGLTLIRGAYLQWVDASGSTIGGKGPELDFLLVGPKGVQEVASAKFKIGRVDISNDRAHLTDFQTLPTEGAPLVAQLTGGRFGKNKDYPLVARANVVSNLGTMSLSSFRATYLSQIPVQQIVITPLTPGPDQPGGLQLRVTRDELVKKTAELMRPRL
jgi:hypothetical protein